MESRISSTTAVLFLWAVWIVSWMIAAMSSDRTLKRADAMRQVPYSIFTVIGVVLLFGFHRQRHRSLALWQIGQSVAWGMVALTTIGLSFSWWARVHLGRLWSRWVARKADHKVIQTGPYAWVRHPIYTGVCLAILATAVMFGTAFAYLGAASIILSFYVKARLEERFLREELGTEAYDAYAKRVPMLVPFLKI